MLSSKAQHQCEHTNRQDVTLWGKAKVPKLTSQLQLELPASAGVCHPPGAGWMPASMTGPKGQAAAAAPAPSPAKYGEDTGLPESDPQADLDSD